MKGGCLRSQRMRKVKSRKYIGKLITADKEVFLLKIMMKCYWDYFLRKLKTRN